MLFTFPLQAVSRACSLALLRAGIRIDMRSAMIAITTRSSINVNALEWRAMTLSDFLNEAFSYASGTIPDGLYIGTTTTEDALIIEDVPSDCKG